MKLRTESSIFLTLKARFAIQNDDLDHDQADNKPDHGEDQLRRVLDGEFMHDLVEGTALFEHVIDRANVGEVLQAMAAFWVKAGFALRSRLGGPGCGLGKKQKRPGKHAGNANGITRVRRRPGARLRFASVPP